jgi:DNA polymerase III subunit delta'
METEHPALPDAGQAPWLLSLCDQLKTARRSNRFPTGLLIHDERGAGGEALARFASQLALCREADSPCGRCRDCRQWQAGQHPDFTWVVPLEESKYIRVEQIRELCEALTLTAHNGGATVVLLQPADSLNANAANALLKTLEEPRAGVSLLLLCSEPSRLPATIVSRCQRMRVRPPSREQSIAWLEQHGGRGPWPVVLDVLGNAPYEALQVDAAALARLKSETDRALDDATAGRLEVSATAEHWGRKGAPLEQRLACIETWITSRIERAVASSADRREMRSSAHLSESRSDMNIAYLLQVLEGAYELRRLRLTSINRSLALEQLLWQLTRAPRATRAA